MQPAGHASLRQPQARTTRSEQAAWLTEQRRCPLGHAAYFAADLSMASMNYLTRPLALGRPLPLFSSASGAVMM
jgi:hypothetical protein